MTKCGQKKSLLCDSALHLTLSATVHVPFPFHLIEPLLTFTITNTSERITSVAQLLSWDLSKQSGSHSANSAFQEKYN